MFHLFNVSACIKFNLSYVNLPAVVDLLLKMFARLVDHFGNNITLVLDALLQVIILVVLHTFLFLLLTFLPMWMLTSPFRKKHHSSEKQISKRYSDCQELVHGRCHKILKADQNHVKSYNLWIKLIWEG